ncbi:hypothetical protein RFI_03381 [Reticulomyxa filosa]|uniref:Uncharacterized protein n=1 Tax=Reticulomyxa filosa TaxID=46433 RepID=X6P595_RETFI|nr:hypothetical protein RFI_03381 [Reticulomyxa filosa]|eukprot:ETO33720.1 hypothetical protein RFI_03381 [Reticulomyxa filosa]
MVERTIKGHWSDKWSKDVDLSDKPSDWTLEQYIAQKSMAILDMYDRTCAMNMSDIDQILRFHKQTPLRSSPDIEPFFLATDGQEPEILQQWLQYHGAITSHGGVEDARRQKGRPSWSQSTRLYKIYNEQGRQCDVTYTYYLQMVANGSISHNWNRPDVIKQQYKRDLTTGSKFADYIQEVDAYWTELAIFDMWMLRHAQFFIGSWHSTLTRTVCHWRGFQQMFEGSNCYLNHKWKLTDTNASYQSWFDLNAVHKPLLTWRMEQ